MENYQIQYKNAPVDSMWMVWITAAKNLHEFKTVFKGLQIDYPDYTWRLVELTIVDPS